MKALFLILHFVAVKGLDVLLIHYSNDDTCLNISKTCPSQSSNGEKFLSDFNYNVVCVSQNGGSLRLLESLECEYGKYSIIFGISDPIIQTFALLQKVKYSSMEKCGKNKMQDTSRRIENIKILVDAIKVNEFTSISILSTSDPKLQFFQDAIIKECEIRSVQISNIKFLLNDEIEEKVKRFNSELIITMGIPQQLLNEKKNYVENFTVIIMEEMRFLNENNHFALAGLKPCFDFDWLKRNNACNKVGMFFNEITLENNARQTAGIVKRKKIHVVSTIIPPFVYWDGEHLSGYFIELLEEICKVLKLEFEIKLVENFQVEIKDAMRGGYWSYLSHNLSVSSSDPLLIAPISYSQYYEEDDIISSSSFAETKISYGQAAYNVVGVLRFNFLLPFTTTLWWSLVGSTCALACFLYLMSRLSPYGAHGIYLQSVEAEVSLMRQEIRRQSLTRCQRSQQMFGVENSSLSSHAHLDKKARRVSFQMIPNKSAINEEEVAEVRRKCERQMSLSNSLYFAFAGLLWQSPESVPRALSSRIPASLWYMIGVVTVTSYTANLVAFVNYESSSLHNFQQLIDQKPIVMSLSYLEYYFFTSSHPLAGKIVDEIDQTQGSIFNITKGLTKENVVLAEHVLLNEENKKMNCKIDIVQTNLPLMYYAAAFTKDFLYSEEFSSQIDRLSTNGFLKKLKNKYLSEGKCSFEETGEQKHSYHSVSFSNIKGVFVMLLIAALFSFIIVIAEWIIASFNSINRSDPKMESHFIDSFRTRFSRMLRDARLNWFPFKYYPSRKVEPMQLKVASNQWKRYEANQVSNLLKPGLSISHPQINF